MHMPEINDEYDEQPAWICKPVFSQMWLSVVERIDVASLMFQPIYYVTTGLSQEFLLLLFGICKLRI